MKTVLFLALLSGLALSQQQAPYTKADLEAVPLMPPHQGISVRKKLFDGKTLDGWRGNMDWWSVKDGEIMAKSGTAVPTNFLFTWVTYSDFRLTLSSKVVESENHAGVCFWGEISKKGENWWYTQGPLVIFPNPGMWDYIDAKGIRVYRPTSAKVTNQHDWIKVEIVARGNRVRTAFNGVEVMDWREPKAERVREEPIGLQLHAWTAAQEVRYKDIEIETFPKDDRLLSVR